ncbi:MAG: BREX-1 system adenine-specific DNA-methyltransferase PglX, partial [Rickettsiales bacterium]|nr:BREX-1 system adenine-specific DNA-methyltransferase PglX [Rickettsiales bacterium]
MNSNEAKKIIEKCFENPYNEENFKDFIINIFKNNPEIKNENFQGTYIKNIKNAFSDYVKSYKRLFKYQSPDIYQDKIDILAVNLKNSQTIQKSRTLQRNFIASYLEQQDKDAVLVAFYSDENLSDWKFSYITRKLIDSDNKIKSQYTSPRRMTFLVGENEKSHTAKKQFLPILQESKTINLPILEQAFSTEIVTDEFYEKYKGLFHRLTKALQYLSDQDPKIKNDFANKEIATSDFAKKTLGQIAFLYFLQKKGWFGVNENADWGTGDKNFLQKIFKNKKPTENFFNDILEPLFYSALAVDRGNLAMYEKLNCRMPFLNGGLFEPLNGYLWEGTNINLPDHLFSNTTKTKDGDIGDGILDIFNRYNFTVCENEPLEKEVAVDPEMLGKVFENLLEIKDRKSKGAFYTPREIVHYMCQETLINFLDNQLNHTISKEDLEFYIKKGDEIIENDKMVIANGKETETYKFKLPAPIYQHSQRIDQLLCNIKVCDPAVGSGAFMLGMLNEIVKARSVLQHYLTKSQDIYSLKLHTIANSIYGVDLDSGAVEITKLRLWLALVVEEREPSPLPNLDHKIMQGNSLLEEYEGIKLFDENILQNSDSQKNQILKIENRLKELNLKIIDQGKKSIQKSKNLEFIKLNDEQQKLQKSLEKLQTKNSSEISLNTLFDDQQQSQYLASLTAELQQKVSQFIFENQRTKKENLKKEIDNLKYQLIEETLKQQNKTEKLAEIKKLRQKNIRQFFIWRLEFCDVFSGDNPGFDVVIGNPPYIQLQKEGGKLAKIYQKSQFESFVKSGDIYCLFYEFGNLILNQNGHLAFITSNKWMRAGYGKKLRKFLSENTQP